MKVNFDLDDVLKYIQEQQVKLTTGIPLGFNRYKEAFDSIERDDSVLIVGGTGSGKSSLVIDKYLINAVTYDYDNPGKIKLHIDYFNLEETDRRFNLKILSNISYRVLKMEYSVKDFQNRGGKKLLLNDTDKFKVLQPYVNHYNEHVSLWNDRNPILIKKRILESIQALKKKGWNFNDPNYYHLVIIDNLKFLKKDNGHNKIKDAIDDLCLGILQDLRKDYAVIPIVLQHVSVSNDNMIVNVKGDVIDNKLKPSLMSLGDSNDTQTPCTHIYSLFKPYRYGIPVYPKGMYSIDRLQDSFRSIIPLKLRDSEFEGEDLCMHFKGHVSAFEELPKFEEFQKNPALYSKYGGVTQVQPVKTSLNFSDLK